MASEDDDKRRRDFTLSRFPPNRFARFAIDRAVVLTRGDCEVMFFDCEKDAGAWCQHVYGMPLSAAKDKGIAVKSISERGPQDGDICIYTDDGDFYSHGHGIIDHAYGRDRLSFTLNASCYRDGQFVSISGGPTPEILSVLDLTYDGLREAHYWRWWDGHAGASQGGHYSVTVPSWRWNGRQKLT